MYQHFESVPYSEGLRIQSEAFDRCLNEHVSSILGFEHPAVITLGRRLQSAEQDVHYCPPNVSIEYTDRGGEATLHSPGQLVVYPVVNIRAQNLSVKTYIHILEQALIAMLNDYGISSFLIDGQPGVYTSQGKIAFLGVRVRNGITQHGLSLNVQNDLSLFQWIRPCGKDVQTLDSMNRHGSNASPKQVFAVLARHLSHALQPAFSLTNPAQVMESRLSQTHEMRP